MWGNFQGWVISAFLAFVIVGTLFWLFAVSRVSAPTDLTKDPANLAAVALPVAPEDAWELATQEGDAAGPYNQAIDAWDVNTELAAKKFDANPTGEPPKSISLLIDARHYKEMNLFAKDPPSVINYDSRHERLENLAGAGKYANLAGLSLHLHNKNQDAKKYLEAAFALGRHLYHERLIDEEYEDGVSLMAGATAAMLQIAPKGSKLFDQLTEFDKGRNDYDGKHMTPIRRAITSADPRVLETYAGDVFVFAKEAKEPMWRVEATLKLGRYRFDAGTFGDQVGAVRAIHDLLKDPDPRVVAAATAARDLTIEQYRMIH